MERDKKKIVFKEGSHKQNVNCDGEMRMFHPGIINYIFCNISSFQKHSEFGVSYIRKKLPLLVCQKHVRNLAYFSTTSKL